MKELTLGFAMTGSFCTFRRALTEMRRLVDAGHRVIPIMSFNAYTLDTRFGRAADWRREVSEITGEKIVSTLQLAEPIGPKRLLDVLLIEPCTGNTLAKLAAGIADTPVTMAAKSHLRNGRPVVIAVSTNDALAGAAKNVAALQNFKHVFFVPYTQDDPKEKPNSAVADFTQTLKTVESAYQGEQIQPVICGS